tara:strand:+ start:582 stop:872 length:291 start_codon:yes stop_codon:yes gene_type:complete
MKIKHKGKCYRINTIVYETTWVSKQQCKDDGNFWNTYQNKEGLWRSNKKLPKDKWTYNVELVKDTKNLSFAMISNVEAICENLKTIDEAKKFIKQL